MVVVSSLSWFVVMAQLYQVVAAEVINSTDVFRTHAGIRAAATFEHARGDIQYVSYYQEHVAYWY